MPRLLEAGQIYLAGVGEQLEAPEQDVQQPIGAMSAGRRGFG